MLSKNAQKILNEYFNLPFVGVVGVRCPYFNNARRRTRGQLRSLIGKGAPTEIVDEAKIISLQYHAGLFDHSGNCCLHGEHTNSRTTSEEIRKFLVDNDLGVECSGFVTQILRAHFLETKGFDIATKFYKVSPRSLVRWLIAKLRPVENISARVWADDNNTEKLADWKLAQVGDVIVILGIEVGTHPRSHVLLVTDNDGQIIKYAHARAWSSEGRYGHGVAVGEIKIIASDKDILEQEWLELGKVGHENETLREAMVAKFVEVRRVK